MISATARPSSGTWSLIFCHSLPLFFLPLVSPPRFSPFSFSPGTLPSATSAGVDWLLLALDCAAPAAPTNFKFASTLHYTLPASTSTSSSTATATSAPASEPAPVVKKVELTSVRVTVVPSPKLQVHYFVPRQVQGDDLTTPQVSMGEWVWGIGKWGKLRDCFWCQGYQRYARGTLPQLPAPRSFTPSIPPPFLPPLPNTPQVGFQCQSCSNSPLFFLLSLPKKVETPGPVTLAALSFQSLPSHSLDPSSLSFFSPQRPTGGGTSASDSRTDRDFGLDTPQPLSSLFPSSLSPSLSRSSPLNTFSRRSHRP
ncbi:unnamed protein product [Closterium sp. NIES-54]